MILIFAFKFYIDQKTRENGAWVFVTLLRKLSDVIFSNPKKIKVNFI